MGLVPLVLTPRVIVWSHWRLCWVGRGDIFFDIDCERKMKEVKNSVFSPVLKSGESSAAGLICSLTLLLIGQRACWSALLLWKRTCLHFWMLMCHCWLKHWPWHCACRESALWPSAVTLWSKQERRKLSPHVWWSNCLYNSYLQIIFEHLMIETKCCIPRKDWVGILPLGKGLSLKLMCN